MKNTLRILAVILAVITLTLVAFAANNAKGESWKQVYTASDLVQAYKTGKLTPKNLSISEAYDDTGYYLRSKAETKSGAALCFTLPTAIDASKVEAVLVGYRTNYPTKSGDGALSTGMDFPKDATFNWQHRYASGFYERTGLRTEGDITAGVILYDGFKDKLASSGATELKYFKFTPWNGQGLSVADDKLTQTYADIEFIAFFESASDALSFDYDKYSEGMLDLTVYNVTYLDKNGDKIASEKTLKGSTYSTISAPVVEYHDFLGWYAIVGDEEYKVPSKFEAPSDITLMAKYKYNEAAYLKAVRADIIKEAKKRGLERTDKPFITGYDGFEFRPDNHMTRAEACTVVARLIVDETTLDNSKSTAFTDLNKNAWYYKYVTYLESIGYLKSYTGEFKPDQKITRAEFVELVYNMGKVTGGDKNVSFKDVPADHPRYEVIMAAAKAGLVNGKGDDTFDPDGDIKRSEVVKVLCIALGRNPDKNSFTEVAVAGFWDINKNHWAYPYVMSSAYEHKVVVGPDGEEIWTSVTDKNNYLEKAPDGLVDKLDKMFDERVESILNSKSEWTVAEGGTVWYFSNQSGLNTNDGKSAEKPLKTIAKLHRMQEGGQIKAGDVVLFKRGDEWHEKLSTLEGVTYSAYGEGAKPRILASIEADTPQHWKETDVPGVYYYRTELVASKDVGQIIFNEGAAYGFRIIIDPKTSIMMLTGSDNNVSNGISYWKHDDTRRYEGYKTLAEYAADIPEADLLYYHDYDESRLYLYSRNGNPGDLFDSIELATHGHGVTGRSNVVIDNLCIKYTGSHGVGAGTCENLTIRNCEIGWIGGSIQNPSNRTSVVRFGNGVEIYGGADGYYVYNNYIYQCFDCGPTVQWSGGLSQGETLVEKDVYFYGNALYEASLEVWCSSTTPRTQETYALLENCRMYDNYVTGSGWGWKAYNRQTYEWCSFYGGGQTSAIYRECYMEGNYFWNNRRHLMKAVPTTTKPDMGFAWVNNVIVHPFEEGSIGFMGADAANATNPGKQYFYDKDTVNQLVKSGALGLNKFYYTPGNKANRRVAPTMYA